MSWFRRKPNGAVSAHPELRRALLCVQTLDDLAALPDDDPDTPFARFVAARAALGVGDRNTARRHMHDLLAMPLLDMRTQLLGWNLLRELAELPPVTAAGNVRGVAIETARGDGLDTLAAFADHSAQWLAADGRVHAAAAPIAGVTAAIDHLLVVARLVADKTSPQAQQRETAPEPGQTAIRVFTFAGVHFGLGPTDSLSRDPSAGPVLQAGAALQRALQQQPAPQHSAGH